MYLAFFDFFPFIYYSLSQLSIIKKDEEVIFFIRMIMIIFSFMGLNACQLPQNLATITHYQHNNQISMHQNSWTKENALNELVDTVSIHIDKKITFSTYFDFLDKKAEVAHDILKAACSYQFLLLTKNFIDRLREKNTLFNKAIKHYIEWAEKNRDTVTGESLDIIQNSKETQPFAILNEIPSAIKNYCMNYSYNSIKHEYSLELTFPTVPVDMTICSSTDMAAVATDDTIFLWDLKTNTTTELTSSNDANYISLAFNKTGSILAVVEHLNQGHSITFWKINSEKIIAKQKLAFTIEAIKASKKNKRTFHVYVKDSIDQTSLPIDNISIILCSTSTHRPHSSLWKIYGSYKAPNIKMHLPAYALEIIKSGCRDLLLCLRAVENTSPKDHESLQKIQSSTIYSLLTGYEQGLVSKKIQERYRALF